MISSVCAGLGMCLLPSGVVDSYIKEDLMSTYPIPEAYSVIPTVIAYRKDHFGNAAFKAFLSCTMNN